MQAAETMVVAAPDDRALLHHDRANQRIGLHAPASPKRQSGGKVEQRLGVE
jgi:hypothetical protein